MPSKAHHLEETLTALQRDFDQLTAMQELVSHVLSDFLHRPLNTLDDGINYALARLGGFCAVDRTYVFQFHDATLMTNTHEWCSEGTQPEIETLRDIPRETVHFWLNPLERGDPVQISDVRSLPDSRAAERDILMRQDIQSLLVVPMMNAGELFGFVGFDSVRSSRDFLAGEQSLLMSVANVVSSALVRRNAAKEVSAAQARLAAITEQASDLVIVMDEDGIITWASPSVERLTQCDVTGQKWWTLLDTEHQEKIGSALKQLVSGTASNSVYTLPDSTLSIGSETYWLASQAVDLREDPAVKSLVLTARNITERRRAEETLAHQATHDRLTDLPNRFLLADRLHRAAERAAKHGTSLGLLFIDIDHFKHVNDGYGHALGDLLLREIARRLLTSVQKTDTVSRFGGDEFIVLLEDMTSLTDLQVQAANIADILAHPFRLDEIEFNITASIGIMIDDGREIDAEKVLKKVDAAMYSAKEQGRNQVITFNQEIQQAFEGRAQIALRMRSAIDTQTIRPVFQPIVHLKSRNTVGFEALARWRDPELGNINPPVFIEVAERIGQISDLGQAILNQALGDAAALPQPTFLTVNISKKEFETADFEKTIISGCNNVGFPPERLCLEITESVLATQPERTRLTLQNLKSQGVKLAIDDFGTGYSSLSMLNLIPFDYLKIDRLFVQNVAAETGDKRLINSILRLATDFGAEVIAEGIETPEQEQVLLQLGCTLGQGYLYGRPAALPAKYRSSTLRPPESALPGPSGQ